MFFFSMLIQVISIFSNKGDHPMGFRSSDGVFWCLLAATKNATRNNVCMYIYIVYIYRLLLFDCWLCYLNPGMSYPSTPQTPKTWFFVSRQICKVSPQQVWTEHCQSKYDLISRLIWLTAVSACWLLLMSRLTWLRHGWKLAGDACLAVPAQHVDVSFGGVHLFHVLLVISG